MARLKVFQTRQGFFDTVVAAASQKAALEAWGVRQDLFAAGAASVAKDEASAAALDTPGVVLRRPVGSSEPFKETGGLEGLNLPRPAKPKPAAKGELQPAKPPPDRSALSAAEAALQDRQGQYDEQRRDIDAKRQALDAEAARLRDAYDEDRRTLTAARDRAAAAYKRAGG